MQKIVQAMEKDRYGTRTLIREVVLGVPFRESQTFPATALPQVSGVPVKARVRDNTP